MYKQNVPSQPWDRAAEKILGPEIQNGSQLKTKSITDSGPKTKIVRLKTFKTQNQIKNKAKPKSG